MSAVSQAVYRKLLFALSVCLTTGLALATDLPAAQDLRAEAEKAAQAGAPLIVVYSRKDCKYCETVKRDYLKPLAAAAQWEAKNLLIRRQRPGSWLPPPAAAQ